VADDEIETNFASVKSAVDKTGEKFESVKETIDKQLEWDSKPSNYRTTKEQEQILNSVLKKCQVTCQELGITTAILDMDSITVNNLPVMFDVLKGEFDGFLRKGLGLTQGWELHTHLLELAEQIHDEAQYPGASDTYRMFLQLSKWEDQVKLVISQQVCFKSSFCRNFNFYESEDLSLSLRRLIFLQLEQTAVKLEQEGVIALWPLKWDGSLGPEEQLAMRRLGESFRMTLYHFDCNAT